MLSEIMYSTKDEPERSGGLLICGTNFGHDESKISKEEFYLKPWAKHFTDYETNRKKDHFVGGLLQWFKWWEIPLENDTYEPTELNLAVTQTNLFYDSSKTFSMRPDGDMDKAFARLDRIIQKFNISGVLFASSKIEPLLLNGTWRTQGVIRMKERSSMNKFWLRCGSSGRLHLAACPHPTSHQKKDDVVGLSGQMQEWIVKVMGEHKRKQQLKTADRVRT